MSPRYWGDLTTATNMQHCSALLQPSSTGGLLVRPSHSLPIAPFLLLSSLEGMARYVGQLLAPGRASASDIFGSLIASKKNLENATLRRSLELQMSVLERLEKGFF